jgi:hypothetical protein
MRKRDYLKKYWSEKVAPNKGKIAYRIIRVGALYTITGPTVALAQEIPLNLNVTELVEGWSAVGKSCFGGRFGFIPVPKSYLEGSLCAALLLTCGVAAVKGFTNVPVDAACVAIIRGIARNDAS